jgi:hypothetical protein
LKAGEKGHTPEVKEPDISHAFNMEKRVDKFGIGLDQLTAHTLNIIEIIEEEKNMLQLKNRRKMKQKFDGVQNQ